jgi:hypothetical protein
LYLPCESVYPTHGPKINRHYYPPHNKKQTLLNHLTKIHDADNFAEFRTRNVIPLKTALDTRKIRALANYFRQDVFNTDLHYAKKEMKYYMQQEDILTTDKFVMNLINPILISLSTTVIEGVEILSEYQEFADVFNEKRATNLPPRRGPDYNFKIEIEPGKLLPNRPAYPCSDAELRITKEYIAEYLQRRWISPSTSPAAAGIVFAKKKGTDKLRLCVDYRALNTITVKN